MLLYGTERRLEYHFILALGADPERMHFDGARGLKIAADGDLIVDMSAGEVSANSTCIRRRPSRVGYHIDPVMNA